MEHVNIITGFHGFFLTVLGFPNVSAAFGGLRDGMAHELSKAEAKDWDVAILDAGHLVATQADKALLVKIWHGFWKVQRYPNGQGISDHPGEFAC